MPELPEIETLARELGPKLVGRKISRVSVFRNSRIFKISPVILQKQLPGEKIKSVKRRGKFLFLNFQKEAQLGFHLGMTGQLFWAGEVKPDAHLHFSLDFEGASEKLFFRDIRRFGGIYFWNAPEEIPQGIRKLGPEPLELTAAQFGRIFKAKKGKIKSLLLDQRLVAGLGNIYADESLSRSGIHPNRRPFRLTLMKLEGLHRAVCDVLKEAVLLGGSSIDDYIHSDGSRGRFQERHRVYGKAGSPCGNCGNLIRRIVISGRSSYFCSKCQK